MSVVRALPTGTVTFLFTDIENSTLLVQELGERWLEVLDTQRRVLREAITANAGHLMWSEGDSFYVVFASATEAANAVVSAQQALAAQAWPEGFPVRVRMGLHTGEATLVADHYVGLEVHRAARIAAAGHGGQIVVSEPTKVLIEKDLAVGVSLLDLGEHRLKDLPQPERIHQLSVDGLPVDFPELKSLNIRRNNLPLQLTRFLGRGEELAEAKELLAHNRLLTMVGAGGVGKTRLAIQLAGEVLEEYAEGVWLVELAPISDRDLVAPTVLMVFGLREQPGRTPAATLIDYLQARQVLIILDNCEHLIEPSAELAAGLLRACPKLRMVATSRQDLLVAGEKTWRVPSLPVPDPQRLPGLEVLAQSAAVALFLDRAAGVNPSFRLTEKSAPLVVQICRELDGIPLAIELAAARLMMLSVEQIADRLKDRFRLLTGGSRTALPRQQTLRAAIDWSFELLTAPERMLLRRLSVFAGGFALDAAESVCARDSIDPADVLDLLTALASKSLLVVDEKLDRRYRLLETLRQYAAERMSQAGEAKQLQELHRGWFLSLAERAENELHGPEQFVWFEHLETEVENLRAAFDCCLESEDTDLALRFAAALGLFWRARGRFNEGRDWLERALHVTEGARTALRAKALAWAGLLTSYQGDYAKAVRLEEESLAICKEVGDDWGTAFALQNMAAAMQAQDEYDHATVLHEQSLELFSRTGDKPSIGLALTHLGFGALYRGEYEQALRWLEDALAFFREVGDRRQIGIALQIMGEVELAQSHYTAAAALLEESLGLVREAKDKVDIAYTLRLLGIVARCQADYNQAIALQRESFELARDFNIGEFVAESLCELGIVRQLQGDLEGAAADLKEALPMFHPSEQFGISRCLEALATVASQRRIPDVAATLLGAASALREKIRSPLRPYEMANHENHIDAVQARLGTEAFEDAWSAGSKMSVAELTEFALRKPRRAELTEQSPSTENDQFGIRLPSRPRRW